MKKAANRLLVSGVVMIFCSNTLAGLIDFTDKILEPGHIPILPFKICKQKRDPLAEAVYLLSTKGIEQIACLDHACFSNSNEFTEFLRGERSLTKEDSMLGAYKTLVKNSGIFKCNNEFCAITDSEFVTAVNSVGSRNLFCGDGVGGDGSPGGGR